jgi:hypothetical protein
VVRAIVAVLKIDEKRCLDEATLQDLGVDHLTERGIAWALNNELGTSFSQVDVRDGTVQSLVLGAVTMLLKSGGLRPSMTQPTPEILLVRRDQASANLDHETFEERIRAIVERERRSYTLSMLIAPEFPPEHQTGDAQSLIDLCRVFKFVKSYDAMSDLLHGLAGCVYKIEAAALRYETPRWCAVLSSGRWDGREVW